MIGHGQLGLRSPLRDFSEFIEQSHSTKDVLVELRPIVQIEPTTWSVDQGQTYVTGFEFVFDGQRRDVVAVKSLLDTGLRRAQSLTECRATPGTFYYDPDEVFGQAANFWDTPGLTWDSSPTMFWDQFYRIFVHLEDGTNPALTTVVVSIGFYFSGAGRTRLGDQQVHPALSEDLLLLGSFETWTDNMPTGWTLYGSGSIPFWDDSVSDWDGGDVEFWDPLTIGITRDVSDVIDGFSSISFATTGSQVRGAFTSLASFVTGRIYRLHGWYKSTGTAQPAIAVRSSGGSTLYDDGRHLQAATVVRNLTKTGGQWRRFIFDFIAPDTSCFIIVEGSGEGTVKFDGLKVQRAWRFNWYDPRISASSLPSISTGSNDIFFGGKTIGVGNVTLLNNDGFMERLAAELEWMNQEVLIDIGGQFGDDEQEVLIEDCFRGFTGLVQNIGFDDQKFTLDLHDQRVFFHIKLPPRLYDDEVFPTMDTRQVGKVRPLLFGNKDNISPVRIVESASTGYGTYEICDTLDSPNGMKAINKVYSYTSEQNAALKLASERIELGPVTDFTTDLPNGQFTIVRDVKPRLVDESTRAIDFDIGGSALLAELTPGLYTATAYAAEVQAQMRAAAGVSTIDVSYSNTTHKFTLSRPSGTFNLKIKTGTNTGRGAWKTLGYNLNADKTGGISYVGDSVTFADADKDHVIRVEAQGFMDNNAGTYTSAPQSLIQIGSDICRVLLLKYMKKAPSIIDEPSFTFSRQRAPESLAIYTNESVSTKDVFDRLEFSNIANIIVNGAGKVFFKVYVGAVPPGIVVLGDLNFTSWKSGASNREVFTTIRVKHDQDPTTGQFSARDATDSSVVARLGRPDLREFETYIKNDNNVISAANRMLELSRTAARKISGIVPGARLMKLEVGDKIQLSRRRAFGRGGVITNEIFRLISLDKNPLGGRVAFEATDDRVTVASEACLSTCQQFCESTCQQGCEQICQGNCEVNCQGNCENSCQVSCEQACQSICQLGCQTACQSTCQDACQASCQGACEGAGCQTACQASCQTACQLACQTACQLSCQGNCQVSCQSGCQVTCQVGCEINCQTACQTGCQTTCEINCQTGCQVSCQSTCQEVCQTKAETQI